MRGNHGEGLRAGADVPVLDVSIADERLLEAVVAQAQTQPERVGAILRELTPAFFPVEHGWRRLFTSLMQRRDATAELKRLALEDYLRYLRRRRHAGRAGGQAQEPDEAYQGTQDMAPQDLASEQDAQDTEPMVQLARGTPTVIAAPASRPVPCLVASCALVLCLGPAPALLVPGEQRRALAWGRTWVGRDPTNDVVLGPGRADVSRRHLAVDNVQVGQLVLTDLSTHGTWVAQAALA